MRTFRPALTPVRPWSASLKVLKPETRRPAWLSAAVLGFLGFAAWGAWAWTGAGADPSLLAEQVESAIRDGRHDRAEAALARLARLRPPIPADRLLRAMSAHLVRHDDGAIAELNSVSDSDPLAAQARLFAGQIELRRNRVRLAEHFLLAATRLDPTLVQAHRELIYIYGILYHRHALNAEFLALSRLVPLSFHDAYVWCLTRNVTWDSKELVPQLRTYVAADPADRASRLSLAEGLRRIGRRDETDAVLAPLPATDPDARAIRVRLALDRGDERLAESLLAVGADDHPELARLRGRLALVRRDGPAAVQHFRAANAAEPDDRDGLAGLGQALTMVGDTASAAPYLAVARDLDALGALIQRVKAGSGPPDSKRLYDLGVACQKARRLPEARAWFQLVVDLDPLDSDAQKALYRLKDRSPEPLK